MDEQTKVERLLRRSDHCQSEEIRQLLSDARLTATQIAAFFFDGALTSQRPTTVQELARSFRESRGDPAIRAVEFVAGDRSWFKGLSLQRRCAQKDALVLELGTTLKQSFGWRRYPSTGLLSVFVLQSCFDEE